MSNAFNLSQLANGVNTSGQVNVASYATGVLPVANGGTGLSAPGTAGNVLTSNGTSWVSTTGGSGSVANGTMYENSLIVSANYTLTTGKNAFSVGPITINAGVNVTIPSGQRWVIL
jgi:hypothetical protein